MGWSLWGVRYEDCSKAAMPIVSAPRRGVSKGAACPNLPPAALCIVIVLMPTGTEKRRASPAELGREDSSHANRKILVTSVPI